MESPERDLLEAIRQGSAPAREQFVRRYAGLVRWAVTKTLNEGPVSSVEADDVFQEVFRKFFEPGALDALRDPLAIKTWIVVAACRTALDARRVGGRRGARETTLEELLPHDAEKMAAPSAPGTDLMEREKSDLIRALLDRLPPRERACLRFCYEEGLTHSRIAEILGLPEATVSTIIRRTRDSLREALKHRGYESA